MQRLKHLGKALFQELQFVVILWKSSNHILCKVPRSTIFPHPFNVVIHKDTILGENCVINQGVTIGNRKGYKAGVPKIGNNVHIFSNAVILGGITIGDNSVIGACALVVDDVPPNSIVYGIPAKVIRKVEKDELYTTR